MLTSPPVAASLAAPLGARLATTIRRLAGHPARTEVVALGLLSVVSAVGTAAAPFLLGTPLLLVALSPRLSFLAIAGAQVPLLPFLVVGTVRLFVGDPLHYSLATKVGPGALARARSRLPFVGRLTDRARAGDGAIGAAAVAVRPNSWSLALAGVARTPFALVVVLDLASTIAYLLALHAGVGLVW